MANTIRHKRGTSDPAASDFSETAELLVNTADGGLFTKIDDGSVVEVGSVIQDTTPQLGGNLDVNGNSITGTGDINVTGAVTATSFSGPLSGNATTATKVYVDESEDDNVNYNILFTDENPGLGNSYHNLQVDNGGLVFNPSANLLSVQGVSGTSYVRSNKYYNHSNTTTFIDFSSNNDFLFKTANTTRATISDSGLNVSGVATATSFSGSGSALTGLTGASAATYGDASNVAQIVVNSDGKITGISNVPISGISNYAKYVGTGTPDLNSSTSYGEVSWINTTPQFSNGTWSATSSHVVVPSTGIYLIQVNLYIELTSSDTRTNIGLKLAVNDTQQTETVANNYIRGSANTESSLNMATTLSLAANDQVSVYVASLGNNGTVLLQGTSSTLAFTQLA